jgi:2-dehydro-3-deoxygluconokinase
MPESMSTISVQALDKILDIVALGEAMVEFNQTHPSQPNYLQGFGGDTSNAVIAAARAQASTAYLTRLGNDHFGRDILTLLRSENVMTQGIEIDDQAPTGIYFVHHTPQGHEFSYRRSGSAASMISETWLMSYGAKLIAQSRWLHLSGISLALSTQAAETSLSAMRLAKAVGTKVSFDSNLRLKLWSLDVAKQYITEAIRLCDLFLPSLDDLVTLTGLKDTKNIIDWCHQAGAQLVVLKLGEQGALISDANQSVHIPARKVDAIDATAAGDCFCGNLLARLSKGDTLTKATEYANIAASLAVQHFGAVASLPYARAVQACRDTS